MTRTYVCTEGHRFTATRPPARCPYAPKGKPCEAEVQPATKARRKAQCDAVNSLILERGLPLPLVPT